MMYRSLVMISIGFATVIAAALVPLHAHAFDLSTPWPTGSELDRFNPVPVDFASRSPFVLNDVAETTEPHTSRGYLFMPDLESHSGPRPAVIMLHGAGGIMRPRELTYGRQFAAMGVAALVIDVFGSRRDLASGFTERLLNITETMFIADAFAGREFLAAMPEIDAERIALIGFSYGGMAATYAAHERVAEAFAPEGDRFAAYVSFYAPCIVSFEDAEATATPLLMLYGDRDEIIDVARCAETAEALRDRGGEVETVMFEGAFHQWDGWSRGGRRLSRGLADCHFRVENDLDIKDARTGMPMSAVWNRMLILGLCVDSDGYMIMADDEVRRQSNQRLADFLTKAFVQSAGDRLEG